MKTVNLLQDYKFNEKGPHSEPIWVAPDSRVLRWTLRPGQAVREHVAPNSPVHAVVLKGSGLFAGGDGQEEKFGLNQLIVFEAGEPHSIRALEEDLVFVTFLREAPGVGNFPSRVQSSRE